VPCNATVACASCGQTPQMSLVTSLLYPDELVRATEFLNPLATFADVIIAFRRSLSQCSSLADSGHGVL
jgi:hypothetical protein